MINLKCLYVSRDFQKSFRYAAQETFLFIINVEISLLFFINHDAF